MEVRTSNMTGIVVTTGSGYSVTMTSMAGTFTLSDIMPTDGAGRTSSTTDLFDRGQYMGAIPNQDAFVGLQIDGVYHDGVWTHAATRKLLDILLREGSFASDLSTDPGCGVWGVEIEITMTSPCGGTDVIKFPNVHPTPSYTAQAEGNTIAIAGTAKPAVKGAKPYTRT